MPDARPYGPIHASITALPVTYPLHAPLFPGHASPSLGAARTLSGGARQIDGVHHTRSLRTDHADMAGFPDARRGDVAVPDRADAPALPSGHGKDV